MNDFERKLRETPFRAPPPAWRAEILAAQSASEAPRRGWREHLWPPLPAWGALAAVWLFILALDRFIASPAVSSSPAIAHTEPSPDSLLAMRAQLFASLPR
jgi:hypothetical protein